jgi:hypothetical protein
MRKAHASRRRLWTVVALAVLSAAAGIGFSAWFKNGRFRVTVDRAWAQPPKEVV